MESLQDIIGRKKFTPPDEIDLIQKYVQRRYKSNCRVTVQRQTIVISLPNSSLAGMLQLERNQLIKACKITQKLSIRTG